MMRRASLTAAALAAFALAGTGPVRAQDAAAPAGPKWSDNAELGFVVTSGNSETSTFGLKNTLAREWDGSRFEVKAGGIRVQTTSIRLFAVGDPTSFSREEDRNTDTTAENYYLNGRYDHKIRDGFFWFAGGGWERNRFAGIDDRYTAVGGVGNAWIDTDRRKWRTDYSVTGTREKDVVEPPHFDSTFLGVRVSSNFLQKFGRGGEATYTNDTIVDENVDHTADLRVNMTNSASVNLTDHVALKVSLQWLYDHQPALKEVDLYPPTDPGGVGTPTGEKVLVKLDDLDSIFTTALVIKY